ncbi:MAG: hypothetical protein WBV21_02965, partial [Desulfobacterales bacterium]
VLGTPEMDVKSVDPKVAIEKMEDELKELAHSLRQVRNDYVNGMITDEEFRKVESQFMDKLIEQRNILQLLRSAAGRKK